MSGKGSVTARTVVIGELCRADLDTDINRHGELGEGGKVTISKALNLLEVLAGSPPPLFNDNGYLSEAAREDNKFLYDAARSASTTGLRAHLAAAIVSLRDPQATTPDLNRMSFIPGVHPWQRGVLLSSISISEATPGPSCLQIVRGVLRVVGFDGRVVQGRELPDNLRAMNDALDAQSTLHDDAMEVELVRPLTTAEIWRRNEAQIVGLQVVDLLAP